MSWSWEVKQGDEMAHISLLAAPILAALVGQQGVVTEAWRKDAVVLALSLAEELWKAAQERPAS